jgi:cephalosporin hydroxylase
MIPRRIAQAFHQRYYADAAHTWKATTWLGVTVHKNPCDLWIMQELITKARPDWIIECGTLYGGSALFLASVCALLEHGHVLSIDTTPLARRPLHPRLRYRLGDALAPDTLRWVRGQVAGGTCMVILDDDHHAPHVLAELRAYSPFVSRGQYCIVEDGNLNGYPVEPQFGPGPREALQQWFREDHPPFEIDGQCEKHGLTFNPSGYLRRIA